ncbi:hypothetical protein QBC34DRAFT_472413 [Podospora aff. communis PSN243]|uniref:Uncharacterized protein n=1 Tax=Podospora aff. communis PSN243 TaxID=3040156 RepID=A0AAV9GEF0_9PEZI|nr:hypothetical protein QBC34DRAFT_472413 [Podospora aff. communis PSN243]
MKALFILALGVTALAEKLEARQGQVCQWTGHCIGDRCQTENDCDLDYICRNQRCAAPAAATTARTTARTTVRVTTIRTTVRPGTVRVTTIPGTGRRTTTVYVTAPRPTTARPGQPQPQPACQWEGHCLGDPCASENDCDGMMACVNRRCANPPNSVVQTTARGQPQPTVVTRVSTIPRPTGGSRTPSCGDNPLACIGVSCRSDADCGFDLIICRNGVCGL